MEEKRVYKYRGSILGKQWLPCIILENGVKKPTDSECLFCIDNHLFDSHKLFRETYRYSYRKFIVNVNELFLAENEDCYPNKERAIMASKIRYDIVSPEYLVGYGYCLKDGWFGNLLDGFINGDYKTLSELDEEASSSNHEWYTYLDGSHYLVEYEYKFYFGR
mgnify:FL=1